MIRTERFDLYNTGNTRAFIVVPGMVQYYELLSGRIGILAKD